MDMKVILGFLVWLIVCIWLYRVRVQKDSKYQDWLWAEGRVEETKEEITAHLWGCTSDSFWNIWRATNSSYKLTRRTLDSMVDGGLVNEVREGRYGL